MARQPRIDFPGAFQHVMNRGAARQSTYRNDLDRELFLALMAKAVSRFEIEIIAFALMGNHYHLFLRSNGELSAAMQFLSRAYTQEFNSHHERDGALFRGRFHSVLVSSETHLSQVTRYVELNPVSAGLCALSELQRYKWSSFQYSSGLNEPPNWLSTSRLWEHFGTANDYRNFVQSQLPDPELERFYNSRKLPGNVLGTTAFVKDIAEKYPEFATQISSGLDYVSPERIETVVMALTGALPRDIFTKSHPTHPARSAAIQLSHSLSAETGGDLATRYGFASNDTFNAAARRARIASKEPKAVALLAAAINVLGL